MYLLLQLKMSLKRLLLFQNYMLLSDVARKGLESQIQYIKWNLIRNLYITGVVFSPKKNKNVINLNNVESPQKQIKIQLFSEKNQTLNITEKENALAIAKESKRKLVLLDETANPYPVNNFTLFKGVIDSSLLILVERYRLIVLYFSF